MNSPKSAWADRMSALRKRGLYSLASRIKPSALTGMIEFFANNVAIDASDDEALAQLAKAETAGPQHFYTFTEASAVKAEADKAAKQTNPTDVTKDEMATWTAGQLLSFANTGIKPVKGFRPQPKLKGNS